MLWTILLVGALTTLSWEEPREIGNYDVTIALGDKAVATTNFVKFAGRRLASDKIVTAPGEIRDFTFTARVPGPYTRGKHDNGNRTLQLELFTSSGRTNFAPRVTANEKATTIYLCGDSTVTDQESEPWGSWGQVLPAFVKPGWSVSNFARSGLALVTFAGQGRLKRILEHLKPGDYVLIQFGHNDQKRQGEEPENGYTRRLGEYTDAITAKGGKVIIVTPVERRRFDEGTGVQEGRTLEGYAIAARTFAQSRKLPCIDLNEQSYIMLGALGVKASRALHVNNRGKLDNTHHTIYGAYENARIIAAGLASIAGISEAIREPYRTFDPTKPDSDPQIPKSGKTDWKKPEGN